MERHPVPVNKRNESVLDLEFRNIRELFNREMQRMDEEMNKFVNAMSTINPGNHRLASGGHISRKCQQEEDIFDSFRNWLSTSNSPLIQGEGNDRHFKLRFDLSGYKPEEIQVNTFDNKLLVTAKHKENGPNRQMYSEYRREFMFPQGTDPNSVTSNLSCDGVLTVEARLPPELANSKRKMICDK